MKKLTNKSGKEVPFTQIPNEFLRSSRFDGYDKTVFFIIMSCNPSFPSYSAIQKWTGFSLDRIWKSLRKLEAANAVVRFKRGRSVEYKTFYALPVGTIEGALPIRFTERSPFRHTEHTIPPHGIEPFRHTETKNTKEKQKIKTSELSDFENQETGTENGDPEASEGGGPSNELKLNQLISMALHRKVVA